MEILPQRLPSRMLKNCWECRRCSDRNFNLLNILIKRIIFQIFLGEKETVFKQIFSINRIENIACLEKDKFNFLDGICVEKQLIIEIKDSLFNRGFVENTPNQGAFIALVLSVFDELLATLIRVRFMQ